METMILIFGIGTLIVVFCFGHILNQGRNG